jgi:hypothetical protein
MSQSFVALVVSSVTAARVREYSVVAPAVRDAEQQALGRGARDGAGVDGLGALVAGAAHVHRRAEHLTRQPVEGGGVRIGLAVVRQRVCADA